MLYIPFTSHLEIDHEFNFSNLLGNTQANIFKAIFLLVMIVVDFQHKTFPVH